MLISSSIPNLINGVSQQPPTLRLASQAEAQVNFLSSVADGLTVRPPSRHLAKIDDTDWSDAFLHTINRDTSERYVMSIRQGQLRVFEAATGVERVVEAPNGLGYLDSTNAEDYRAVTVADFTFILNRKKTVLEDPATLPARPNQALVYARAGNYGKEYRVLIDGVERAYYQTRNGGSAEHAQDLDTGNIAQKLYNDIRLWAEANPAEGFVASRKGNVVLIERTDDRPFSLRAEDGDGGTNLIDIHKQVQRFSDLPPEGFDGFEVEVVGDNNSSFDNYFVKYVTDGSDGVGVWEETIKGGETYQMIAETMPHRLTRRADGVFEFNTCDWEPRDVGDLEKVPHPSFTGRTINDIFFYRNRLGLAADENVILSQDGEYFDFYRSTATTVLDTDPIDVAVTSDRVSIINFAVPFNKTLLLFSDQLQFSLEGGQVLTPQSVAISQVTSFESLSGVRPVGVGQRVYFPVPRGGYSSIREYFVQEGGEGNDALEATSHVPNYIPRSLSLMEASSAEDTIVCLSADARNSIWVYRFFYNQEGKLQSAWSRWDFESADVIQTVAFIESKLFMVVSRGAETFIDTLSLESGNTDPDSTVQYNVDRGVTEASLTSVFDGTYTTFTLPFPANGQIGAVVRGGDAVYPEGYLLASSRVSPTQFRVVGNHTATKLMVGVRYVARYEFSTFYLRTPEQAGGISANANGRLQIRYLSVDYTDTAHFRLRSTPKGRAASERVFSGQTLGVDVASVGGLNLATGRFRIPVMSRNLDAKIEIICDTPLPASFTAAEWEASYNTRARKY